MDSQTGNKPVRILLTGATGFLGKVVLHELVRRQKELAIDSISVIVRAKNGKSVADRFFQKVVSSPCFDAFPKDWHKIVHVVSGELSEPHCGIDSKTREELSKSLTHVIHCAASVDFNLPLRDASRANIEAALNVLGLARDCINPVRMVSVSTAYVTPHNGVQDPVLERLAPLPFDAEEIFQKILRNEADESDLLKLSKHPNTYTFTKCIAEHLLMQAKESVSLQIVRPSIISASWRYPVPGWIDSAAAFAGFVALIGTGYLRVVLGQKTTRLDVIPCDEVAHHIIDRAFSNDSSESAKITHAVAGIDNCYQVDRCCQTIVNYFSKHPMPRKAQLHYVGRRNFRYYAEEFRNHKLPIWFAERWFALQGKHDRVQSTRRLKSRLSKLNSIFEYFTHNTFDFKSSAQVDEKFDSSSYIDLICEGVSEFLIKKKSLPPQMKKEQAN